MLSDFSSGAVPSVRSDAWSNIGRIVAAAREALAESSAVTLTTIARRAGVGIATLYRHFPNREALAEAVMEQVFSDDLQPLLTEFGRSGARREDLLEIAERFVEVLGRERGIAASLGDLPAYAARKLSDDADLLRTVERAQRAGNLRSDLDAADVPALLAMVTTLTQVIDADPNARRRYLSLLLDGLNPARAESLPTRGSTAEEDG